MTVAILLRFRIHALTSICFVCKHWLKVSGEGMALTSVNPLYIVCGILGTYLNIFFKPVKFLNSSY